MRTGRRGEVTEYTMPTYTTKCDRCGRRASAQAPTPGEALLVIRGREPPCWPDGAAPDGAHLFQWPEVEDPETLQKWPPCCSERAAGEQ